MEVILKKTKITKSIVEQSLSGSLSLTYEKLENHDILGWCIVKKGKYAYRLVLIYNNKTNQLFKLNYTAGTGDRILMTEESVQRSDNKGGYIFPVVKKIKILYPDLNNSSIIEQREDETYEDMEEKLKSIRDFYKIVNEKGQIYL